MAKITYATKYDLYEDTSINETNKVVANDMNEIKEAVNTNENKILVAVSDTAPSTCATGDVYYNTSTKKLYTATATNTWSSTGVDPTENTIYIVFDTKTTYSYDGTDLVSVGGGGAEVAVQTTEPTGEDSDSVKIWINPNEAPSGSLNPISNTYGVAQDKGYSQEYVNGKLEYNKTHISTANIVNGTLSSASVDIRLRKDENTLKLYGQVNYASTYSITQVDIATGLTNLVDATTTLLNIAIVQDTTDNNVKLVVDGTLHTDGTLSVLVNPSTNGHSYKVCFMNNEIEL